MIKANLISLGCAKNLVDSEQMLDKLFKADILVCENTHDADVCIVNTCGFIESAKAEAIENILELVQLKNDKIIKGIVVTGCLTERYKEEFLEELPEVDAILGTGSYDQIVEAVLNAYNNKKTSFFKDKETTNLNEDRVISTGKHTAYIKISEGCNNNCAFCIIPKLRGKYRSRTIENIVHEASVLAKNGTKEIIIIAQDVTRYGYDLYKKYALIELLEELSKIDGIKWIRLHYLYPELVTDELLTYISKNDKVLNYFDIPMQHINDRILKLVKRHSNKKSIIELITKIRKIMPESVIRTSLIVGLPSETKEEFNELLAFLEEYKIERAGIFAYSKEEGTEAFDFDMQVLEEEKQRRKEIAEQVEARVIDEYNDNCIGKTAQVLVDGFDTEFSMYYGRTYADSLDVDGKIYFASKKQIKIGDFCKILITDTFDPFLQGQLKEE